MFLKLIPNKEMRHKIDKILLYNAITQFLLFKQMNERNKKKM